MILELLEKTPLFRGIPHKLLAPIFEQAVLISLDKGERLLSPGIINEHVYIIISGKMGVHLTLTSLDEPFAILNPGDCAGEMSVLVDSNVSAYVIAQTDCQLLAIGYSSFWSLIKGSNESARNMLNILVQRIRMGNEVIAETLSQHDKSHDKNAVIDNITGLYNRHGMQLKFDRMQDLYPVAKQALCLIILQEDEAKNAAAYDRELSVDPPLRAIAQTILTFLRRDDHAARLSGKRFAVLLANVSFSDACVTAERLRATLCKIPILLPDGSSLPPLTISAGICKVNAKDSWSILIARANRALERAIDAGGNRLSKDDS